MRDSPADKNLEDLYPALPERNYTLDFFSYTD